MARTLRVDSPSPPEVPAGAGSSRARRRSDAVGPRDIMAFESVKTRTECGFWFSQKNLRLQPSIDVRPGCVAVGNLAQAI